VAHWHRRDEARGVTILHLHVQPGAKRTGAAGTHGEALKIRLAAPAVEGKANAALVSFLAEKFGVPARQVVLVRGEKSREKVVEIAGSSRSPECLLS
jgi:uncharacterized protein